MKSSNAPIAALIQRLSPKEVQQSSDRPSLKYSFALEVMGDAIDNPWLEQIRSWDESASPPAGPNGEDLRQRWKAYRWTLRKQIWGGGREAVELGNRLKLAAARAIVNKHPGATVMGVHLVAHEAFIWIDSQQLLIVGVAWPYTENGVREFLRTHFPRPAHEGETEAEYTARKFPPLADQALQYDSERDDSKIPERDSILPPTSTRNHACNLISARFPKGLEAKGPGCPNLKYSFAIDVLAGADNVPWLESIGLWDDSTTPPPPGPNGEDLRQRWEAYQFMFWKQLRQDLVPCTAAAVLSMAAGDYTGKRYRRFGSSGVKIVLHNTLTWIDSQKILIVGIDWPFAEKEVKGFIDLNFPESDYVGMKGLGF
jgi:hypothetical protein